MAKNTGNSTELFDYYSIAHIFAAALLTKIGVKIFGNNLYVPIIALVITTVFEVFENLPEQVKKYRAIETKSSGNTTYYGDSGLNTAGDIIFNMIGIFIGYLLPDAVFLVIMFILFIVMMATIGPQAITDVTQFLTSQ